MNPDVTCVFQGRLGNNLFQVAAAISYAHKNHLTWAVPVGYEYPAIYRFMLPTTSNTNERTTWTAPVDHYEPIPHFPDQTRLALSGFFQSWKFFEGSGNQVRSAFPTSGVPPKDSVSIHIRRTDFVNRKHKLWNPMPLAYYAEAISMFTSHGQNEFIVFSDDIKWCRSHLQVCSLKARLDFYDEPDPYLAISEMASCQNHIIANSTFSWWGAWLDPKPKKVVCPHHNRWFGPEMSYIDTSQLYPSDWVEIP